MVSAPSKTISIIIPPSGNKPFKMLLPYGALYLESYFRQHGYRIQIIDVDIYRYSDEEVVCILQSQNPFLIGISGIVTTTYNYIVRIAATLKMHFPDRKIVLGSHAASAAKIILAHTPIDFVVHGEGEITFLELCEKIYNKETDFSTCKGISYINSDGTFIENHPREQIQDLGELPYPNLDLLDLNKYLLPIEDFKHYYYHDQRVINYLRLNPSANRRVLGILFSRGCAFACTFCYRHIPVYRRFPVSYAVDWLEQIIHKHRIMFFNIFDDNFNSDHAWVYAFAKEVRARKLRIYFSIVYAVAKNITAELLETLKEIGCVSIFYGLDSGSNRILSIMGKNRSVDENEKALCLTREAGLKTAPQIVIGMPGETRETVEETIAFLKKMPFKKTDLSIRYALALPRTALYEYDLLTKRILDEHAYLTMVSDRPGPSYAAPYTLNHTDMSDEELAGLREYIFGRVFGVTATGKTKKIVHQLIHAVRSPMKNARVLAIRPHRNPCHLNTCHSQPVSFRQEYYQLGSLKKINEHIKIQEQRLSSPKIKMPREGVEPSRP